MTSSHDMDRPNVENPACRAREILDSDEYSAEIRARERFYTQQGINSVPSIILNDRHLIQGGQAPETFEQALRQVADAR